MVIWSGYGFLVFIIVFLDSLVVNFITNILTKNDNFYDENVIPLGVSFLLSALIIKLFWNYFNKKKQQNKGTYVFDKVTIAGGDQNSMFFIPFRYWTYIMTCLGIIVILYQLLVKNRL